MSKTTLGIEENIESALSYFFGPFTGIFFLVMERENKTVRFHAMQSTIFFGAIMALQFLLFIIGILPIINIVTGFVAAVIGFVGFVAWIYLMFMAFSGKNFKIPYIGDSAWNAVNK
jgi:uncharacterized membrane protein